MVWLAAHERMTSSSPTHQAGISTLLIVAYLAVEQAAFLHSHRIGWLPSIHPAGFLANTRHRP
ncbi:hypothetical protein C1I99_16480 [Micromonospora deserti]|uniref:Uncharacterized protein n=2 Tax=Micromonospora deserti TaxID=2070366 RepID=A0A2W2DIL2_9ACTN|nr:hypothetical protein C1I99_16480 [Micromonospora deserti]